MSLLSMTGYGHGTASGRGLRVSAELSTVNRKQLDVHVGIPRAYAAMESRVYDEIRARISRGRVYGELRVEETGDAHHRSVAVDEAMAHAVAAKLRKLARDLRIADDLSASALLRIPQLVTVGEPAEEIEVLWPIARKALRRALRELVEMRRREGEALKADLEKRLAHLESSVARIERRAPRVARRYRDQLLQRIRAAGLPVDGSDERLVREVALFVDRSDISEELTRLRSHVAQCRARLEAREPVGRPLDFLSQELFREINTVGSKANDAEVTRRVVAFKTELERFREQVQNIE